MSVRDNKLVVCGPHRFDSHVVLTRVELSLVARALEEVAHTGAFVHPDEHRLKVVALCGKHAETPLSTTTVWVSKQASNACYTQTHTRHRKVCSNAQQDLGFVISAEFTLFSKRNCGRDVRLTFVNRKAEDTNRFRTLQSLMLRVG